MDLKSIMDLLKMINKSSLTDVEIEQKDFKMRVQRRLPENVTYNMVPSAQQMVQPLQAMAPAQLEAGLPLEKSAEGEANPAEAPATNTTEFKSPIIGTFYRSPSPDQDPFVKVGDIISKGQVVCIIEAMKLFNEIESEVEGRVVKVLAENAQPVEFDQALFLIEPV